MVLSKVKDNQIHDLTMQLRTKSLKDDLAAIEFERRMGALGDLVDHARKHCTRYHFSEVVLDQMDAWITWRALPWYRRIFKKQPKWWVPGERLRWK